MFKYKFQFFSQKVLHSTQKKHKENAGKITKKIKQIKSKKILKFYPNDII